MFFTKTFELSILFYFLQRQTTMPIKATKILLSFIILFCNQLVSATTGYIVPNLPTWVVPVQSDVKSKVTMYDVNSGYYTTLYDNQMNLETAEDYVHFKLKVLTSISTVLQRIWEANPPMERFSIIRLAFGKRISMAFFTSSAVAFGAACHKHAPIPAITGDEKEVPLAAPIPPLVVCTTAANPTEASSGFIRPSLEGP